MTVTSLFQRIATECAGLADGLVQMRRDLHRHPEIGLNLSRTQAAILKRLARMPELEIRLGTEATSVVAVLRGGGGAPGAHKLVVLLRGDMDALPVTEKTGLPYASNVPNAMHACGHDLHIAGLCGAAEALYRIRDLVEIDVVFMFQPGEEGYGGAKIMIQEGVLTAAGRKADAAYGLHVFSSELDAGVLEVRPDTLMAAADVMRLTVHGQGGHGSTPHRAKDPIPMACEIVLAIQTLVTREFDIFDPVVATVGMIHGGTACNVIPDHVDIGVSVRTYSEAAREKALRRIPALAEGIASAQEMTVTCECDDGYPATVNDPQAVKNAVDVLTSLFGVSRVRLRRNPMPGSEDFSFVLNEVPGAFLLLGAVPADKDASDAPMNHSPYAEFDDSVLVSAACALACLAVSHQDGSDVDDDPVLSTSSEG